ncbi:serine/threonine protein kinase, partial [Streptomyces sp. SID9124]|nr:serine/threonine protein kinase [Streptomyces sp. SID9124]
LPGEREIDAALDALAAPVVAGDEAGWLLRTELYEWKLDAVRARAGAPTPRRRWLRMGLPPPPVPGERAVRAELEQCYRWLARQRQRPQEYERLIDLSHAVRPQTRF